MVVGLDAELAFPLRVEKIAPGLRQILFAHEVSVVGRDENVQAGADPFAVRAQGLGHEIGEVGRPDFLQQLLAMKRFEFGSVGLEDVDFEAAAARFVDGALHDGLGTGAPDIDLDAVFLFEGRGHCAHVAGRGGSVDGEAAFLFCAISEPLRAVGALVKRDLGYRSGALRLRWRRRCRKQSEQSGKRAPEMRGTHGGYAALGGRLATSA